MANIREYLQKKEKRNEEKDGNFGKKIFAHRMRLLLRILLAAGLAAVLGVMAWQQFENQTYTSYVTVSSIERKQYNQAQVLPYREGFLTYSKDGIHYTDAKGNAVWNQTFEMQRPIVKIHGDWVAVGDYNGHVIFDIGPDGTAKEIDTNLPIRDISVAANGVVAAVLEESSVTWINVYNPNGDKAVGIKTTMQKSGYPVELSLSSDGKLMQVAYLRAESGAMKSVVSFYNFDEVGKNYTDTMVSSYEYANSVIPFATFMNADTAFAVADDQLVIYEGAEIPKNIWQTLLTEEIQSVFYGDSYIALVFLNSGGMGKYRVDVYDTAGSLTLQKNFTMEYRDIFFTKDNMIIYNEAECMIVSLKGNEKYVGQLPDQTQLFRPVGGSRYLAVTREAVEIIEMR